MASFGRHWVPCPRNPGGSNNNRGGGGGGGGGDVVGGKEQRRATYGETTRLAVSARQYPLSYSVTCGHGAYSYAGPPGSLPDDVGLGVSHQSGPSRYWASQSGPVPRPEASLFARVSELCVVGSSYLHPGVRCGVTEPSCQLLLSGGRHRPPSLAPSSGELAPVPGCAVRSPSISKTLGRARPLLLRRRGRLGLPSLDR